MFCFLFLVTCILFLSQLGKFAEATVNHEKALGLSESIGAMNDAEQTRAHILKASIPSCYWENREYIVRYLMDQDRRRLDRGMSYGHVWCPPDFKCRSWASIASFRHVAVANRWRYSINYCKSPISNLRALPDRDSFTPTRRVIYDGLIRLLRLQRPSNCSFSMSDVFMNA